MKKFLLIIVALLATIAVSAKSYIQPSIFDNTYVQLTYGVTNIFHPRTNGYNNYAHSFAQQSTIEFGKYITPHFGLAINGSVGWDTFSHQKMSSNTVSYVDVSFLGKYKFVDTNKFMFAAAAGPSWVHHLIANSRNDNDLGIKMQLEFAYKLTNRVSLLFIPELNYNFTKDVQNPKSFQPYFSAQNAWYGLNIGASYRFGGTFMLCPYKYTQEEFDALNGEVNALREELKKKPNEVVKYVDKVVVESVDNSYTVFFKQGKSDVSDLSDIAKKLNKTDASITIVGSTSPEGSERFNRNLALARANAVKDALVKAGVDKDRITVTNEYGKQRNATIILSK